MTKLIVSCYEQSKMNLVLCFQVVWKVNFFEHIKTISIIDIPKKFYPYNGWNKYKIYSFDVKPGEAEFS